MPGKNWKLQTRLLVREGAPHQQTRNCLKLNREGEKLCRGSQMDAWPFGSNIILTLTLTCSCVCLIKLHGLKTYGSKQVQLYYSWPLQTLSPYSKGEFCKPVGYEVVCSTLCVVWFLAYLPHFTESKIGLEITFCLESKSHCDWQSVSQYVLVSSPNLGHLTRDFSPLLKVTVLSFWGSLSDERSGLSCVSLCHWSLP
jgi:hypothetical protein